MSKQTIFDDQVSLMDFQQLQINLPHVSGVEVRAVSIDLNNRSVNEVEDADANAFGVYIRYNTKAIETLNLNPSVWVADFGKRETAENFKLLLINLVVLPE